MGSFAILEGEHGAAAWEVGWSLIDTANQAVVMQGTVGTSSTCPPGPCNDTGHVFELSNSLGDDSWAGHMLNISSCDGTVLADGLTLDNGLNWENGAPILNLCFPHADGFVITVGGGGVQEPREHYPRRGDRLDSADEGTHFIAMVI